MKKKICELKKEEKMFFWNIKNATEKEFIQALLAALLVIILGCAVATIKENAASKTVSVEETVEVTASGEEMEHR